MLDLWSFAAQMRGALYQCGQMALALRGRVAPERKPPDSPRQQSTAVTVADRLSQEILLLRAHELAPEVEIYSEELAALPEKILRLFAYNHHRYVLVLDPIDGTDDYIRGAPTYAHMLGLLDQVSGRMALGMIYFPEKELLYTGVRSLGAFRSSGLWGTPEIIRPATPPRTVGDTKRLSPEDKAALAATGFVLVEEESASAAWEAIRVAEGRMGANVLRHFHGHDSAPTSVVIEALGGVALDERGEPVRYARGMPRMPLVLMSLLPDAARELCSALKAHDAARST